MIEKYYQSGDGTVKTIFRLRVSQQIVHFHYQSVSGEATVDFLDNVPQQTWIMYAIQVLHSLLLVSHVTAFC